ncbi:DNA repair protein SWI5 homolog, partial [Anas platyrhynchos]|uniref:DNA repair protein SWI5 homolog n=1 Tax=Anas platyrhynchos TaxID=8839 RepID=UPI003AF2600E
PPLITRRYIYYTTQTPPLITHKYIYSRPRPCQPSRCRELPAPACPARGAAYNSQHPPRLLWHWRAAAALAEGLPQGSGRCAPQARRSLGGPRRSGGGGFKSPVPASASCRPPEATGEALRREIEELRQKELALDQEIAQLMAEGYSLEELEKHIALLHEYNDIKDAGQMLLGKLAVIRGVTTKQLYPEYDLELSD